MKKLGFLQNLKKGVKAPLFTDEDLKLIFYKIPHSTIRASLTYHLKVKNIIRLKRGLYSLVSEDGNFHFTPFQLANSLYDPSYVSFESALSHYGLIPEAVYTTTSACFQVKKKEFKTPMGIFSYNFIPLRPFFLEVIKNPNDGSLIASELRALFDLIYLHKKNYQSLKDLEDDLRIDLFELRKIINQYQAIEIEKLGDTYKKKVTKQLAKILIRGFK